MSANRSLFNIEWQDKRLNPEFSTWIKSVPNNRFQAHCSLCLKNFELSNMGRSAVVSHLKSASHVRKTTTDGSSSHTITSFITTVSQHQDSTSVAIIATEDSVLLSQPRDDKGKVKCTVVGARLRLS